MFRETILVFLLCCTNQICLADDSICSKLAGEAEASGITNYPSAEAKVIGSGKIGFYSAPTPNVKLKACMLLRVII